MQIVVGVFRAEMATIFGPPEWDQMLKFLGSFGQPTYCLGTVENSPDLLVGMKLSMCIFLSWMAWIAWKMIC